MISNKTLYRLLTAAVVLPIVLTVTWGMARLLEAMSDAAWVSALDRACLVGGLAWATVLICLLIVLGIRAAESSRGSDDSKQA